MALASPGAAAAAPTPAPSYILRLHQDSINDLAYSTDGQRLFSCDADGYVAVWSLDTFRPLYFWKAHQGSVLAVAPFGRSLVSHGRDNMIHVYDIPQEVPSLQGTQPSHSAEAMLEPSFSLETNALTHCKLSILDLGQGEAWIAVPAVLEDDKVDVLHLPSRARVCRSIGAGSWAQNDKTGTCMALNLHRTMEGQIRLLVGYEDGRLAVFESAPKVPFDRVWSGEGEGWHLVWSDKGHKEPIMSLALNPLGTTAWTVAADHLLCRWRLSHQPSEWRVDKILTPQPGRSSVSVRGDNKIVAVGGWDGAVRVHSAKTAKPLAVLQLHRDSVHAVAFRPMQTDRIWLAVGGKDQRISLWEVYPPT